MSLVFVPVGSFEQHGPHLPFETDSLIALAVSKVVAARLKASLGDIIEIGVSVEHMDFPGTKTLTVSEFKNRIIETEDIYPDVIFINGHGGNNKYLKDLGVRHVNLTTLFDPYDHAGEIETSMIMFITPELVEKNKITKHEFKWPDKNDWKMKDYSETGVLGDPTKASPEKGEKYFNKLVEKTIQKIRNAKS